MRKRILTTRTNIVRNKSYEGKPIERMISDRLSGDPIEVGGKALMYTLREDGVLPETNIRTDKWDIAQSAIDARERSTYTRGQAAKKAREEAKAAEAKAEAAAEVARISGETPNGASTQAAGRQQKAG